MKKLLTLVLMILLVAPSLYAGQIKAGAMQHKDLVNYFNAVNQSILYGAYVDPGLTYDATASANIKVGTATSYTLDGVWGLIAANVTANISATQQNAVTGNATFAYYLVTYDGSSFTATKGTEVNVAGALKYPDVPEDEVLLGAIKIETSATVQFTLGTTSLDGTVSGVTVNFYDIKDLSQSDLTRGINLNRPD